MSTHFAKGLALGYAIPTLPALVSLLIKFKNPRFGRRLLRILLSKTSLRQAIAFAVFSALTNTLDCPRNTKLWKQWLRRSARWIVTSNTDMHEQRMTRISAREKRTHSGGRRRASSIKRTVKENSISYVNTLSIYLPRFAAAFVAGFIAIEILPKGSRKSLAIMAATRAADSFAAHAISHHPEVHDKVPEWILKHFDSATFIFSTYFIISAWFADYNLLPPSYASWIDKMGGISADCRNYIGLISKPEFKLGKEQGHMTLIRGWMHKHNVHNTDYVNPALIDTLNICHVVHPDKPCHTNFVYTFLRVWKQAFPMYMIVHILLPLLFRFRSVRVEPIKFLIQHLLHTARSSAFLAGFTTLTFLGLCLSKTQQTIKLSALLSGLAIFLEKGMSGDRSGRRAELALYVLPKAIEVIWGKFSRNHPRLYIPKGDSIAFAGAVATITTFLQHEPLRIRPTIRSILQWYLSP